MGGSQGGSQGRVFFFVVGVAQSMYHGRDMATQRRSGGNREGPESTLDGGTAEFGVKG